MSWQPTGEKDFAHRVLDWVSQNQKTLLLILVGGVLFFGTLAVTHFRKSSNEQKAQTDLYLAGTDTKAIAEISKEFPESSANKFALIRQGIQKEKEGNLESCLQVYTSLYNQSKKDAFFRVFALHGTARCYMARKDYQGAALAYERAALEPGHVRPDISRYEAARCYTWAGDPKAEEIYRALSTSQNLPEKLKERVEEQLIWYALRQK